MNLFAKRALALILMSGAGFAVVVGRSAAVSEDEQAVLNADRALAEALGKGDKIAVGKLLDANFEWTDTEGATRVKGQVLQNLSLLAADTKSSSDTTLHYYGQVALLLGIEHNPRFSHIWVKRPEGWRAFIYFDTPTPPPGSAAQSVSVSAFNPGGLPVGSTAECENPCRTIPYKPTTAADRDVLAAWQKQKMAEWFPDSQARIDDWVAHASDDLVIFIPSTSTRYKADRLAELIKQKEAGARVTPGGPIDSMRMYDFGETVIYTAYQHQMNGTPYYAVRVWLHQGGAWKIALSQQTNINKTASARDRTSR